MSRPTAFCQAGSWQLVQGEVAFRNKCILPDPAALTRLVGIDYRGKTTHSEGKAPEGSRNGTTFRQKTSGWWKLKAAQRTALPAEAHSMRGMSRVFEQFSNRDCRD